MKTSILLNQGKSFLLPFFLLLFSFNLKAQTETLSTGSFIINMGATNPNTIANGLKPYGMIYDLMSNNKVPIKWVISSTKAKDGADFNYNGVDYKGGTFIIPAENRNAAVNAKITSWQGQGVVGTTTTSPLTVFVTRTLVAVPRWTLDAINGAIAQGYLNNAGIPTTAYNWKAVAALDCCDDFYVMPHADPTWATHNRLFTWNKDCLGSIWAACHAVSALENSINPANSAQQMNFLSTRTAATTPTPWPNNSLKLWGQHSGGSVPYTHQLPSDQVAQYIGTTDLAQLNGSEQIYIPKQSTDVGGATRWNPGATIIAYDPTQVDVPLPNLANGNVAATIVYGRGMDDPARGFVMYEAGHSHNKGTVADVAAQRAFLNFSFFQVQPKAPQLSFSGISGGQTIPGNSTITGLNVNATSPLSGITFSYQWSSSCGGTFSNATGVTTNFTAPNVGSTTNCILSCTVTDNCGRTSFQSFPVIILGAAPPTANADAHLLDAGCGAASVSKNVLANDVEPDGQPMTLTQINGNTGSFTTANGGLVSFTSNGNVSYTSAVGFVGVDVLTYTVCDNSTPTPQCSNGTYTITVGNPANIPNAVNDVAAIAEDNILANFNVLANDLPLVSGPITVSAIVSGPANGKVSINTDNTLTYVPNADFAGVDVITYRIVNSVGYSKTATLTVTVNNDACDGGTYQSGSATPTIVSGNDWSKVYTRPVNTGGTGLTNTIAYPINSGTNRLLVLAISAGGPNPAGVLPTVTWGGRPLTSLAVNRTDNNRAYSFIFYLKETDIAAGVGNNLIVNMGTPSYFGYVVHAAVYSSVNQTTSVRNAVSPLAGGAVASPITASTTADFVAGDQGIFVTGYSTNGGTAVATYSSVSANWTGNASLFGGATSSVAPIGPYYGGVGVRNITTAVTGETVSMTVNATGTLRPSITVVSLIPGSSCAAIPSRAPLAMPDTASTNSSTVITIPVVTNDALFGMPVTSVTISTAPSNGSATVVGNSIQYTPSGSFNGLVTLQYTVATANGSDVVRVYINVTSTPVIAVDDAPAPALSGTVQTITVKTNDIDPEGTATSTVTVSTATKNGTATVNGSGQILYTPNTGFTGNDTLYYSICEPVVGCGTAFCDTARVVIVVQNRAPVATNDNKTILPCYVNTISLLTNDTDPENNALSVNSVSAISPLAAGTLVNNNDGTVTFTPAMGFTGLVTFTYDIIDNGVTPQVSAPATVTINVQNPVNTAPVAVNDADITNMDQKLFFNVRDNDSDPENNPLSIPTITVAPLHGTATVNPVNGLIEYTPNPGYFGTDVLTYQICDIPILIVATCSSGPDLCSTATLTITIAAPNTIVANNDENSTWVNTPVTGGVMGNDLDPEGDAKLFTGFLDGGIAVTSGSITVSGVDAVGAPVANAGALTINADGTYIFTPTLNFTGVVTVPYTISDNQLNNAVDTAVLKITVSPNAGISNSVIANNDENSTLMNTAVSSTLFGNDSDPQTNLFTATSFQYDTNGDGTPDATGTIGTLVNIAGVTTTGVPVTNAGSIVINANGTYTFTPVNDFTGTIEVPYTITDALGATSTAILRITILPDLNAALNNPPIPGDDFATTSVNNPVTSSFISNDNELNGNPISLNGTTIVTAGPHTPIGAPVATAKGGTIQYYADGTYTYTPPAGYVGPDSTSYTVCDVTAVNPQPLCRTAFIHLLVGANNTTDAVNDENSTWQDVNVTGTVVLNDFDKENNTQTFGSFLAQGVTPGAPITSGATVSGVDKTGAPVANAGTLTFAAGSSYTFDPDPAFTGTATIPYNLCDNGNLAKCDTAFLTITIDPLPTTGINTVIANNDENITYGSSVSSSLIVNDRDPQNDAFNVTNITGSTVGTPFTVPGIDQNGSPVANAGTLVVNADGTYLYTPATGFKGSINTSYTITDALAATSIATFHIDVLADPNGLSNDPPFAGDDFSYTTINRPVNGNFINNDSDPNGNPVSFLGTTIVPGGAHTPIGSAVATVMGGTVQFYADGTYTYTPPIGYIGPDAVNYTICDVTAVAPQPLCANAQIQLLVGPGISIAGKVWDDANGNVIDPGASEPETNIGGTLYVNLVNNSGNIVATVAVNADGSYNFSNVTPGADYSLSLSTIQGTIGQPAPAASLPSGWTNTGETRNGTIDLGNAGVIDTRTYGFTNTINFDFGIEQLPETDNKTTSISQPVVNQLITLNGGSNPPVLSGSDPEDQPASNVLTNKSIEITTVPANSELYYNGVLVTNGQVINNFNPGLLEIKITAVTILSTSTSFTYSYIDAAGKKDPTPATYTLNWLSVLPATGLKATASLQGETTTIKWETLSEQNTSYFVVERSLDNTSFAAVGNQISAAGNSFSKREYQQQDNISSLNQYTVIYYRIKLTDIDGKINYSNVVAVRINKTASISAWPNPFSSFITISVTTTQNTEFEIRLTDLAGRTILNKTHQAPKGTTQITLNSINKLANGVYLLNVTDMISGNKSVYKFIKDR